MAAFFGRMLREHPFVANAVIGAGVAGIGDAAAQRLLEGREKIDWRRVWEMMAIRTMFVTPALSLYYPRLMSLFPGTRISTVAKRIAFDQLVWVPIFVPAFYTATCAYRGDIGKAPALVQDKWLPTVLGSHSLWPVAHLVTFALLPRIGLAHLQIFWVNLVGVAWSAMLSAHANDHSQAEAEKAKPVAAPSPAVSPALPALMLPNFAVSCDDQLPEGSAMGAVLESQMHEAEERPHRLAEV